MSHCNYNDSARFASLSLVTLVLAACSTASTEPVVTVDVCAGRVLIEVVALDIWGREATGVQVSGPEFGAQMELTDPAKYTVTAIDLLAAELTVSPSSGGISATATGGALVVIARSPSTTADGCGVDTVFVGLDHPIYAAGGRAPKAGNNVDLLIDGEAYWGRVYEDLKAHPTARVHQTTWWWQSDFELWRSPTHAIDSADVRREHTMLALLAGRDVVREVVSRFAAGTVGGLAYLNTDKDLRDFGRDPNDRFEVMLQANPIEAPLVGEYQPEPLPVDFAARVAANEAYAQWRFSAAGTVAAGLESIEAASFHQKGLVIGAGIAFISGMNVKSTDWDTNEHRVFEPKRMTFAATAEERQAVVERKVLPDRGPRKDYGIRVEGPAARDADDVLRIRWNHGIQTGAMFVGDATPYDLLPPIGPVGSVTAQVVATMPPPIGERSILETQAKAVRQAKQFIYIEDQYFRAPVLDGLILEAMRERPELHLVVVTKPITVSDGGKKWTVISDQAYRTEFPDRYALLQFQVWDKEAGVHHFVPMDTHSKLTLVDDDYVCVGSANKNNRGYLYEGELDVAVWDKAFATDARLRVLKNVVGPAREADIAAATTGKQLFDILVSTAEANAAFQARAEADADADGAPVGFPYPLVITPDFVADVGPDVF